MISFSTRCLCLLALLAMAGCESSSGFPKTYPVTGTVKVKGKPIDGAVITFQNDNGKESAIGTTNSNGEFKLSMFRPSDGAIPGQYRVAVTKPSAVDITASAPPAGQIASGDMPEDYEPPAAFTEANKPAPKSEIPAKYGNDQTSGLRATVIESDSNHFDFDLE